MSKKRRINAAIAIIEHNGQILICQRHQRDSFGGLWEFPGGKREAGESWEACVRREIHEEVGVTIRDLTTFGWMRHEFPDGVVTFKVFRCALAEGEPQALDAQEVRWIHPTELPHYQFPPANQELLARLASVCQRRLI